MTHIKEMSLSEYVAEEYETIMKEPLNSLVLEEALQDHVESHDKLLMVCKSWVTYLDSDLSEAEIRLLEITKQAISKAEGK